MKVDSKEKYKARFARRGHRPVSRVRFSDYKGYDNGLDGHDLSFRVKYDGTARVHNIEDCWPLLGRKDLVPTGHVHHGYPAGHGH